MQHIIKNYRNDDKLRKSFNDLAKTVFGLDFEDWYQNGYWTERYNPYSVVIDGKVVANVSVNKTDFEVNGQIKHYIQLGTVMTYEEYRNRGYIRMIMEQIDKDYEGKIDGMYLFAGDDVSSFYPKFGFTQSKEYQYFKQLDTQGTNLFKKVKMNNKNEWDKLQHQIKNSYKNNAFELVDNSELYMFYVSKFMNDDVYYSEALDTYVIAKIEGEELEINSVISTSKQDINRIANGFGKDIKIVKFGFTPICVDGFEVKELKTPDCTLFIKGNVTVFDKMKVMVPYLAHA